MKLTITHLKAPWPAGAKVGDVLDLPAVPVWAAGKCRPAPDDAIVVNVVPALVANVVPAAVTPKPDGPPNETFVHGRGTKPPKR